MKSGIVIPAIIMAFIIFIVLALLLQPPVSNYHTDELNGLEATMESMVTIMIIIVGVVFVSIHILSWYVKKHLP